MYLTVGTLICHTLALAQSTNQSQPDQPDLNDPKLQENAKLPRHNRPRATIEESLAGAETQATTQGINTTGLEEKLYDELGGGSSSGALPLDQVLEKLTCYADAIITGHAIANMPHLSQSHTTIYSDYNFVVDQVLKDNAEASLKGKAGIVITQPGGTMKLGQGKLKTYHYMDGGLPVYQNGAEYLSFLKFLPATDAYTAVNNMSTFVLTGNQWMFTREAMASMPLAFLTTATYQSTLQTWLNGCAKN